MIFFSTNSAIKVYTASLYSSYLVNTNMPGKKFLHNSNESCKTVNTSETMLTSPTNGVSLNIRLLKVEKEAGVFR